jgi:hypothetical protein
MGDKDLNCETEEELSESIKAIKKMDEDYQSFKHLQYEFIVNHEKLEEGVFCTTYSNGTKVTVDYNTKSYEIVE